MIIISCISHHRPSLSNSLIILTVHVHMRDMCTCTCPYMVIKVHVKMRGMCTCPYMVIKVHVKMRDMCTCPYMVIKVHVNVYEYYLYIGLKGLYLFPGLVVFTYFSNPFSVTVSPNNSTNSLNAGE